MNIKSYFRSILSILLIICITISMIVASGALVSAAEIQEDSVGENISSEIKAENGVTYHYVNDEIEPNDDAYYLNALQKTNQFEYWASVMYSMLESGGSDAYETTNDGIYTSGASDFKRDFGYGQSKYGYGTRLNPDVKQRENGRMIRMVEALKGNTDEATRYAHGDVNHKIKNHIIAPKTAVNPASVYNELMNASCFYSSKCSQKGIEEKVDLKELKELNSSSKVVYSLFCTDDYCCYNHSTTSMGLMFYNISMVPMCDYVKETSTVQNQTVGESKTYALINDSTVTATIGGGLTETHSESKSNTVSSAFTGGFRLSQKISFSWKLKDPVNFLWKFPSEFGVGADFSTEEFFQWTNTNASSETISKQKSNSSNFSMPVPARSVGTVTEKNEGCRAVTTYDGPVAITYDVAMFSLGVSSYESRQDISYTDGRRFFATFSSHDKEENAVETVSEVSDSKSSGGFKGYYNNGNREQILSNWSNTLNTVVKDENCSEIIKKIVNNQPMTKFNGTLEEKNASVSYEVGKNYALEPIGSISVSVCNEYNDNYKPVKTLDLEGDGETFLRYDKIEASTPSGIPFVGWTPKYGYWVLESPDGTESALNLNKSVADDNVVVRMNGAGNVYVTPIKNYGESYLKYVIVDNHFKYYPYEERGNSDTAVLMDSNTLKSCTNDDIPEGFAKGKIALNIMSDELDSNRIGLESCVDGNGQISLSKYVASPGDKIKVSVNAERQGRISKVVAQYHEDKRDPSKVTREEIISEPTKDIRATFDYTIPENTTSKVSIVAKIKSFNLTLDTKINDGEIVLSNNNPCCGDDVNIRINAPIGYGIQEIRVEYPTDEGLKSPEIIGESILSSEYEFNHKFNGDATIFVVTKPLNELKIFDTDQSGNFIIKTADDLCKITHLVNTGIDEYVNGSYVLANDIDLAGKDRMMIGHQDIIFNGVFDGQGNTIKNLNNGLNGYAFSEDPLFAALGENAYVKNLNIDNASVSCLDVPIDGAGVLAKQNRGMIKKCIVTNSKVEMGPYIWLGGLVGLNKGIIEDCAVIDTKITRYDNYNGDFCAGGIAEQNDGNISKCFTYNCTFDSDASYKGGIIERGYTPDACYYYTTSTVSSNLGTEKTAEEFASGEVAYHLNKSITNGGQSWYQKVNEDKYPNFIKTDDNTVYNTYLGYDNCMHDLQLDSDGNFLIKTFDDLRFMAGAVNSNDKDYIYASYILANDIDCKGKAWTNPIGKYVICFEGTFDGQGHTIKNLNVDSGIEDGKRYPLFATLWEKAVVKNLIIDNASVSPSDSKVCGAGGIAQQNHGTIKSCVVKNSTIELGDYKYLGGLSGNNNGTIENCAVINSTLSRIGDGVGVRPIGGVVETNHGKLKNCFSYGCTFNNGSSENGGVASNGYTRVNNCYYYTTSEVHSAYDDSIAKTAEQFASGEVAVLLGEAFGQKIGTDEYPVLGGDKVYTIYTNDDSKENIYINTPLLGDVDFDGVITIKDASIVSQYLIGKAKLNEIQLLYADINQDGIVNISDLTAIQKILTDVM